VEHAPVERETILATAPPVTGGGGKVGVVARRRSFNLPFGGAILERQRLLAAAGVDEGFRPCAAQDEPAAALGEIDAPVSSRSHLEP
jgi:hypothetical protein